SGIDLKVFWKAGGAVWRGEDPYQDKAFLNPPTALPLDALFGLLPFAVLRLVWTLFSALGYLAIVALTQYTLLSLPDDQPCQAPPAVLAVLTAAVVLSYTCRFGLVLG